MIVPSPVSGVGRAPRQIEAVLFDLDGVLVDSFEVWVGVVNEVAERFGRPSVTREFVASIFGQGISDDMRNLYPGRSGLSGVLAVHLHRCGFTGPADAPADIYGAILGEQFDPAQAVDGLGEDYRIATNYFKLHACCRINHYALDALARIVRAHRFDSDDVEHVTVTSIPFGERMAETAPATMLAAKFSIPYAVAASLVLGRTDPAAFDEVAVADPRIRRLAARVEIASDPAMNLRRPDDYPTAVVTVALRDGRTLTDSTTVVRGDAAAPADLGDLIEKFETLAAPTLGAARARAVVEAVDRVDELKDIRDLTSLLVTARG